MAGPEMCCAPHAEAADLDAWGQAHRGCPCRGGCGCQSFQPGEDVVWHVEVDLAPRLGETLRDVGMAQVLAHTEESYKEAFDEVVRSLSRSGQEFTSEDVTSVVGMPPNHPNAVGALTRSSAIRYGCVKVGRVNARRPHRHASEIAVWRRQSAGSGD